MEFLEKLGGRWNISLFHYRNHGADFGRVLAGFEVPAGRDAAASTRSSKASAIDTSASTKTPRTRCSFESRRIRLVFQGAAQGAADANFDLRHVSVAMSIAASNQSRSSSAKRRSRD